MSIDTTDSKSITDYPPTHHRKRKPGDDSQWHSLRKRVTSRARDFSATKLFGDSAKGGAVYRWGMAAAQGGAVDPRFDVLSRLACGQKLGKKSRAIDLKSATGDLFETLRDTPFLSNIEGASAVTLAAALPALSEHLEEAYWWQLLSGLRQLHESVLQRSAVDSPANLLIGAEMGLTLAWRLHDLPSCKPMEKSSAEALAAWCKQEDASISAALGTGTGLRLILASLIRTQLILETTTRRKWKKSYHNVADRLATWVAALTTHTGQTAFCDATAKHLADDLPPHGLLSRATSFDPEALEPAMAAALGETQSGGRLAWEVSLPEAFHHDDVAKLAVMFPDWDVRRGRTHLDYSGKENRLELFAGRTPVITGPVRTSIELDGQPQQACGDWSMSCEFTDDDVHYVEIEQEWTGGLLLARQLMLVRDDRCMLLADSIVPRDESADFNEQSEIGYRCELPLAPKITFEGEQETREGFFNDGSRRAMIVPLSASEWRIGPTRATLQASDDQQLALSSSGKGSMFAPLWFDFQRRRFRRKRTWRQLTVADTLRIVDPHEAVGFRVQLGSEQWFLYRSLGESRCRSVLGKHLIADFFAARFDTGDGSMEELVTVDADHLIDD